MANPESPKPPPRPSPTPPTPTDPRTENLNKFATQVQSIAHALEERSRTLTRSESNLQQNQATLHAHQRHLHTLESQMRLEMTHFLADILQRQRRLVHWESRTRIIQEHMRLKLSSIRELLPDFRALSTMTANKRAVMRDLEARIAHGERELEVVRDEVKGQREKMGQLERDGRRMGAEKTRLEELGMQLQTVETGVRARERAIGGRERELKIREERVRHLEDLERVVGPLQSFLDEVGGGGGVQVKDDVGGGVAAAVAAARRVREMVRGAKEGIKEVEKGRAEVAMRERRVREMENTVRVREAGLNEEVSRVKEEMGDLEKRRVEMEEMVRGVEEARRENEERETAVGMREMAVTQKEQGVKMRIRRGEDGLGQMEKELSRRERGIRRAYSAVCEREKGVEQREREVEMERGRVEGVRRRVGIREDMLETKDLELSARQVEKSERLERLLRETVHRGRGRSGSGSSGSRSPKLESEGRKVRRHLAFESVGRRAEEDADDDDNSEVAAEQLLPELIEARSLWRERASRLQAVVMNMREDRWCMKLQVQPVLRRVEEQLRVIRDEMDEVVTDRTEGGMKVEFGREQIRQTNWGVVMREQLDTVREVQTGVLIGLNKEEEEEEEEEGRRVEEEEDDDDDEVDEDDEDDESSSKVEEESSVEATLDATVTGDVTRDIMDMTEERDGGITSSFEHFRVRMRTGQMSGNRRLGGWYSPPPSRRVEAQKQIANESEAVEQDVMSQLAYLRNELDTITIQHSETSAPTSKNV